MKEEKWIVGAEYDSEAFSALGVSLRTLGYKVDDKSWGVGGSQEISTWKVKGPDENLIVESETYIGLSVSGAPVLIAELRQCFENVDSANKSSKRTR